MSPVTNFVWPTVVGVLVGIVLTSILGPRLNAIAAERGAAFEDRRQFKRRVMTVLALCGHLRTDLHSENPVIADRFTAERARWLALIEEHSIWMADNVAWIALGWPNAVVGVRDLVAGYAAAVRIILLSERPETDKIVLIGEISSNMHMILNTRRTWSTVLGLRDQIEELRGRLAKLGALPQPQAGPTPAPATVPAAPTAPAVEAAAQTRPR